ncbi:hypothetical protein ACOSQ4_004493 [Xanthoceras sorbifolium]
MRAVSPVKTRNGRGTRESVPAEGDQVGDGVVHGTRDVLLEREVQPAPSGSLVQEACASGGCDVGALTKRPTTIGETPIFVFGATPEYPVAVVGDAGTAGKVDITGGRRWKRRARARGEQDIRMGQEDIGGKRMGYLVCVDSDHGPKRS